MSYEQVAYRELRAWQKEMVRNPPFSINYPKSYKQN
jgi:hypothetical protein